MIGATTTSPSRQRVQPPATSTSLLPLLYAFDPSYAWSAGMRAVTLALLAQVSLPPGLVVEVGCGGGQMLVELQRRYPQRLVVGADLQPLALAHARAVVRPATALTQAALPNLPWGAGEAALVVALDVFDQEGVYLPEALAEAYRLLRSGGALVMRVSAHPSLYGAHDRAFHTGQRYTYEQVQAALLQTGFAVQRLTFANLALALPTALLRLGQRWGLLPWQPALYQQAEFHQIAAWLLRQEAKWLHHANLPWGLSLCAVARKP
jgi:SAM-dependent methyltransferase